MRNKLPKTFDEIEDSTKYTIKLDESENYQIHLKKPNLKIHKILQFRKTMIVLIKEKSSLKGMKIIKLTYID